MLKKFVAFSKFSEYLNFNGVFHFSQAGHMGQIRLSFINLLELSLTRCCISQNDA